MIAERVNEISKLNDTFRQTGSGFMITPGIMELPDVCGLIGAVQRYDEFNQDSDPYGEHDFGKIEWNANDIFWKIDYYDQQMKCTGYSDTGSFFAEQ